MLSLVAYDLISIVLIIKGFCLLNAVKRHVLNPENNLIMKPRTRQVSELTHIKLSSCNIPNLHSLYPSRFSEFIIS